MMKFFQSGSFRDVSEHYRGTVHESSRGNRSRQSVFDGRMWNSGRNAHGLLQRRFAFLGFLSRNSRSEQGRNQKGREKKFCSYMHHGAQLTGSTDSAESIEAIPAPGLHRRLAR